MAAAQQKATIKIPDGYTDEQRAEIAAAMVEMIRDRSDIGVGVRQRGSKFVTYDLPEYTPEYAARKGSKRVDLKLSEQMLDSIRVLSIKENEITVGFKAGTKVNAKAEGNQIGSYGKDQPNPKKARRFLGITAEELDAILAAYPDPTDG